MILGSARRDGAALVDAATGRSLGHAGLRAEIAARAERFAGPKGLVMVAAAARMDRVLDWLACMEAGHAIMLLPPDLAPARLSALIAAYRPQRLLGFDGPVFDCADCAVHPDLCLLLSTSGSSGSPRMVRLSHGAVRANAQSIAAALEIGPGDAVCTSLPLSYSYGLSLLHSHLWAGGCAILTEDGVLSRQFWDAAAAYGATSLAGVPFTWQSLRRLDLAKLAPAGLKTFTQAGGKLADPLIAHFHQTAQARGGRLFVMYGQTEAVARMAVLPPDLLPAKLGSVGRAIPGGAFSVEDGEILYRGPNVMMGYARTRADLALGDELGGVLRTGDRGRLDADGCLWIDGRMGRVVKIVGLRFDLDEIEARAAALGEIAVECGDDRVILYCAPAVPTAQARAAFVAELGLSPGAVGWKNVDRLPRNAAGKVDYPALRGMGR